MTQRILNKVIAKLKDKKYITWVKPNLNDETGEYFENIPTKEFLKSHNIEFTNEKEILDFLEKGKLVGISKPTLENHSENLEMVDEVGDWEDAEYQESYKKMQQSLLSGKDLRLPAPIFIKIKKIYYLFAGNRRVNLAFNNKVPLKIWLVTV